MNIYELEELFSRLPKFEVGIKNLRYEFVSLKYDLNVPDVYLELDYKGEMVYVKIFKNGVPEIPTIEIYDIPNYCRSVIHSSNIYTGEVDGNFTISLDLIQFWSGLPINVDLTAMATLELEYRLLVGNIKPLLYVTKQRFESVDFDSRPPIDITFDGLHEFSKIKGEHISPEHAIFDVDNKEEMILFAKNNLPDKMKKLNELETAIVRLRYSLLLSPNTKPFSKELNINNYKCNINYEKS